MKRALATLLPWGVVTMTLAVPAEPAGVTAVMLVALTEETCRFYHEMSHPDSS